MDLFGEDKKKNVVEESVEPSLMFPIFIRMKQGGYMKIEEDGSFTELHKKGCRVYFICGNRFLERYWDNKELLKEKLQQEVRALCNINFIATEEEFKHQLNHVDEQIKKFAKGEMQKEFIEDMKENSMPPEINMPKAPPEYFNY